MHVAVTGAAGMIGRKLTDRLVADSHLGGVGLDRLSLFDVVEPATPEGWTGVLDRAVLDLAAPGAGDAVVARRPEVILHLAAVVSGEAEADFDKGYRVNLDGTRHLLEAIRRAHLADGYLPRLVFTSSIAVYGAPLPDPIPDEFPATPRHELRDSESDRRVAAGGLHPAWVRRRGRHPAADHLHPSWQAKRSGIRVLLQHPARAAGRPGGGVAGARVRPALARLAALGGRLPDPGGDDRLRLDRAGPDPVDAGRQRDRRGADRGAASRRR